MPAHRTLAAALVLLAACGERATVPEGAQLTCSQNADCVAPLLLCDPALKRCVEKIEPAPMVVLSARPQVGTRGTVFTFDATQSTDPGQGSLRFAWKIDGAPGDGGFGLDTGGSGSLDHAFAVGPEVFCPAGACVNAVARSVSVRVTNSSGHFAETRASVVIQNTRPVADFGEDLFVSEEGVPFVTLDVCGGMAPATGCTTYDPDRGDALTYSPWRQISGLDAGAWLFNDKGRARFKPPARWSRPLVFEAEVSDGLERSTARVRVYQSSVAWAGMGQVDGTFRLHPDSRFGTSWRNDAGEIPFNSLDSLVAQEDGLWFGDSEPPGGVPGSGKTIIVHLDSSLNELERWELERNSSSSWARGVPSLVPPAGGRLGCAVVVANTDAGREDDARTTFARFGSGVGLADRRMRPDSGYFPLQVLAAGASSDCWTVATSELHEVETAGAEIGRLHADGTWSRHDTFAHYPGGAAVEPDGTLWVAEYLPRRTADGGEYDRWEDRFNTLLHRYPPSGAKTVFDLDAGYLAAIAAHDRGGLWANDGRSLSLLRVTPDGRASSTRPVPIYTDSRVMTWDPVERALWVIDGPTNRLYRFLETSDGGLALDGRATPDELPANAGDYRLGFAYVNQLAVDPKTGAASAFVGGQNYAYVQWVTIPSHFKRAIRVADDHLGGLAGDPTSGHVWSVGATSVRRLDARGRVLLEVPNPYQTSGNYPQQVVDRSGRLWVPTTSGAAVALRALEPDGTWGPSLPLPSVPLRLTLEGEVVCGVGVDGSAWRARLSAATVEPLSLGGLVASTSAPALDGGCWIVGAEPYDGGASQPQHALRFVAGSAAIASRFLIANDEPSEPFQVMGLAAEPLTGGLYLSTWLTSVTNYHSYVRYHGPDGTRLDRFQLQGGQLPGIALGVATRQGCAAPSLQCRELFINNHLSRVLRTDPRGALIDSWPLPIGSGFVDRFSLVP